MISLLMKYVRIMFARRRRARIKIARVPISCSKNVMASHKNMCWEKIQETGNFAENGNFITRNTEANSISVNL